MDVIQTQIILPKVGTLLNLLARTTPLDNLFDPGHSCLIFKELILNVVKKTNYKLSQSLK